MDYTDSAPDDNAFQMELTTTPNEEREHAEQRRLIEFGRNSYGAKREVSEFLWYRFF